jgi:hypothetical protein
VTSNVTQYQAAGGQATFTVNLTYPAGAGAVSFSAKPPGAAWAHVSTAGTNPPQISPQAGETTDPADAASVWGWSYQDIPLNGTASFTFTISYPAGLTGSQAITFKGQYNASNVSTPVTIASVTLEPQPVAPTITTQPANQTVAAGQNATFAAAASGVPAPTLKWQRSTDGGTTWANVDDGSGFAGTTTGSLTVNAVTLAMTNHRFRVVATSTGSAPVNSNGAILTVSQAPQIVQQPAAQATVTGGSASFSVSATGSGTLTYQWYFTPTGSSTPSAVQGATSATLNLTNVQTANLGDYVVVVSNGISPDATSQAAQLSIAPRLVKIVSQAGLPSGNVVIPVQLIASGSENALGFSINYDPAQLTFVSAVVGAQAADATLNPNSSQAASGRVGIALSKPTNAVWSAGTQEIVKLTFTVASGLANGTVIPLTFGDTPITREVVSATVDVLPAGYSTGAVNVTVGYEADMNSSNTLTIADWVRVGRIVAGLDPRPTGADFLKADCSPRLNTDGSLRLGNGSLTIADWVQAGRYAAGLDPITPAGGPPDATPNP